MQVFIKIISREDHKPEGKLADAEIHFAGGELDGLKLIGFAVWARRDGRGANVTFPARQYSIHGERRSYVLLRAIDDASVLDRLRDRFLQAYAASDQTAADPAS